MAIYSITIFYIAVMVGVVAFTVSKGKHYTPSGANTYSGKSMANLNYWFYTDDNSLKAYKATLILMTFLIFFFMALENRYDDQDFWKDWTPDEKMVTEKYQEKVYMEDLFRTKSNTWSNLFYVTLGVYCMFVAFFDSQALSKARSSTGNYVIRCPPTTYLFGLGCLHVGFGSLLFHASMTMLGRQIDVAAMYSPLMAFISMAFGRWYEKYTFSFGQFPSWFIHSLITFFFAIIFFTYKWEMDAFLGFPCSAVLLPTLIVFAYGLTYVDRLLFPKRLIDFRWYMMSFGALLVGVICREVDVAHLFSGEEAIIQGHSLWHLCTAISLYWMYIYNRSEISNSEQLP